LAIYEFNIGLQYNRARAECHAIANLTVNLYLRNLRGKHRSRVTPVVCWQNFAYKRKDDKWQQYAAFTSARFVYEFFINEAGLQIGK
jgi:hypothetical protein